MPEQIWHLQYHDFFSQLDAETIRRLESKSRTRTFSAGALIGLPGNSSESIFVVARGIVKISHITVDGKESIHGFISQGEIFGELSVLGDQETEERVHAVEPCSIIMIPAREVRDVMDQNSGLVLKLTKLIGLRRHRIERRLKNLLFTSNRQRLVHLLLDLAEQFGVDEGDQIRLKIKLSHQDLASLIGSTRETVTILLNQLKAEGAIETGRQKILLKRPHRLANSVSRRPVCVPLKVQSFLRLPVMA